MSQAHRSWWRDPLLHFIVLGGAAFLAHQLLFGAAASETITAQDAPLGQLREDWFATKGALPSAEREAQLIDEWIEDEALYRRAIELGLDQNDTIVRRQLVQRMRFLLEDTYRIEPPTDAQLQGWLDAQPERFALPIKTSFSHLFFSRGKHGTKLGEVADAALKALAQDPGVSVQSDPFFRGDKFEAVAPTDVQRAFGGEFAGALAGLPVGKWAGPVPSAYGLHLVRVSGREAAGAATLTALRDEVEQDWLQAERARRNKEAVAKLRARYEEQP